jgi:hypothetical protein
MKRLDQMEPPMTGTINLSELTKPLAVATPAIGEVFIAVHGGFKDWLVKGVDHGRWTDGLAMTRAILIEQARTLDDAPLTPDLVAALDDDQLEVFAAALLAAGGGAFQPGWIRREGARRRLRARRRRDDEAYDMSAREGETGSMRLHRLARDLGEDLKLRDAEITAQILGPNHAELSAVARHLNEVNRLAHQTNLADINRTGSEIAKASAIFDALMASTTRAAVLATRGADLTAAQKAIQTHAVSGVLAAAKAFQTIDISAKVAAQGMLGVIGSGRTNSISVEVERLLASNRAAFETMNQVLGEQSRTIQAALAVLRGPDWSSTAKAFSAIALPRTYFEELRRGLHVPNPAAGMAVLAAMQSTASPLIERHEVMAQVVALRPGYQMTAALGLTGTAPRGVAADVLRAYETEPGPARPVFGAAVRTAHFADVAEARSDQIEDLWATIRELQAQVRTEKDPARRFSLLEIINFIIAITALLITAIAAYGDHLGRVADQTDRGAQARVQDEQRRDQAAARAEAADRYRTTRYVATDGPLRTEPHAQGPILQFVYSGQLAIAKDQRDGWVRVEVFSYASEQPVVGWLPARRLKVGGDSQ